MFHIAEPASIFGFWTEGPGPLGKGFPIPCRDAWRTFDPGFEVFDDTAVLNALSSWPAVVLDLYLDIRIPACRSDIARLALLKARGGTYIDGHTVPGDFDILRNYMHSSTMFDLTIPEIDSQESSIPFNRIFNSPISARPYADILGDLLTRAFANLRFQRDIERSNRGALTAYSIFDLTGPNMIRDKLIDFSYSPPRPFNTYRDLFQVYSLNRGGIGPFRLYWYDKYRLGANHWTSREKQEPLFFSSGLC
ncbi:hypothetical protein [Sphingomonas bacterium]|uniref:hypothetical protein n=1 Tax=Sphingomonas bacterium TaxID=1895847 RepID=UPI001576E032|nr:hypothetical protein [Sphingomonas bacterium]